MPNNLNVIFRFAQRSQICDPVLALFQFAEGSFKLDRQYVVKWVDLLAHSICLQCQLLVNTLCTHELDGQTSRRNSALCLRAITFMSALWVRV